MKTSQHEVSLKEHFNARIDAIEKAIDVAYEAMQARLDGMNEFRDQLKDQASRFTTRTEVETQIDKIDSDIRGLRESRANLEGKASQISVFVAYAISLISIILGIIGLLK